MISIVIPVKNGAQTLRSCLDGLQQQTVYAQAEIIIIDSGSTDQTAAIVAEYGLRYYQIAPEEFNHGATRNLGVQLARGEYVLMTVQDATPTDASMLEIMLKHFDDPKVAGVCGQQIVPHHPDKNPHEWFRPRSKPQPVFYSFASPKQYEVLHPADKKKVCSWDDVCALYRKDVLLKVPFKSVTFGEDMLWAEEAFRQGYTLVYDFNARVAHYHESPYDYLYRRTLTVLYNTYKFFGYARNMDPKLKDYLRIVYRNIKEQHSFKWIPYNFIRLGAMKQANYDFHIALRSGEKALEKLHNEYCQKAPQASINKK